MTTTCTKPECKANKTLAAKYFISTMELLWHYGQVMTKKDRHELAEAVKGLCDSGDIVGTAKRIHELMERNEVEVIVKSKHKEIPYNPICIEEN